MSLAVVIPVLNEAAEIVAFLRHVRERLPRAEIIVVDGGSADGTWRKLQRAAEAQRARVLRVAPGRARQMNAGARLTNAETLLFLHADSRLPEGAGETIAQLLADVRFAGGCFRLRFAEREWIYRISDSLGNLGVDLFQFALGDHGIFCRRRAFLAAGGFPEVPLMEDAQFYRALRSEGRVRQVRAWIETSPRRYQALGPYRTTAFYLFVLAAYVAGVAPAQLARWHRWFTQRSEETAAPRVPLLRKLQS